MADEIDGGTVALAWATALIDALGDAGVETAVVAPGSRSTPLVLAAADHEAIRTISLLDERSGAYFALGRGKADTAPTAVITTSGTAVANAHPAVIEAHESRVPLIVITADRPPELTDSGANQTIDQTGIYGRFVRWERTLGEPSLDEHRLRSVRAVGARAVSEAMGPPAGAVHLNVPVRKPLEPPMPADRRRGRRLGAGTTPTIHRASSQPTAATVGEVGARISSAAQRAIVVGPAELDDTTAEAILDLASAADMAVFADPASGLRLRTRGDAVIGGYDGYIDAIGPRLGPPDVVVRVGPEPVSTPLRDYLDVGTTTQVLLDTEAVWRDAEYRLDAIVRGDPAESAAALVDAVNRPGDASYVDTLLQADETYWSAIDAELDGAYFEGAIAAHVAAEAPASSLVFAGNSMPIRDLDRFATPREAGPPVIANRGVSGIDGTVSTALGAADATGRPVLALLGDLSTYHDMNGLLAVDRVGIDATFVVVNNDGGGIFHHLPIEDHDPPFERLFKTPHGLDFEAAARQYDLWYTRVTSIDALASALQRRPRPGLIECRVDARQSHRTRERVTEAAQSAVLGRLNSP